MLDVRLEQMRLTFCWHISVGEVAGERAHIVRARLMVHKFASTQTHHSQGETCLEIWRRRFAVYPGYTRTGIILIVLCRGHALTYNKYLKGVGLFGICQFQISFPSCWELTEMCGKDRILESNCYDFFGDNQPYCCYLHLSEPNALCLQSPKLIFFSRQQRFFAKLSTFGQRSRFRPIFFFLTSLMLAEGWKIESTYMWVSPVSMESLLEHTSCIYRCNSGPFRTTLASCWPKMLLFSKNIFVLIAVARLGGHHRRCSRFFSFCLKTITL